MQPDCVVSLVQDPAHDESVRQILANLIGESQYDQWFRRKTRFAIENDELLVYAASAFHQKWLQKQHREPLAQTAKMLLGPAARLRFDVDTTLAAPGTTALALPARALSVASAAPADQALRPAGCGARATSDPPRRGRRFADLSDFVVGPCNAMAITAVRHVCQSPENAEGPLFIYGAVGMGKTHLLEGLYSAVRRKSPALQVVYLTAEQFTNHFTQGFRDRAMPAFRNRFRTVDVLLVDDVDFLDAKRGVQEEFLHTWQQLESHGKLVVACGDRHPRLMTKISDELKTRFLSGMVCRLEPPDLETREQIAICKARGLAGEFSPEALKYAARRFSNNVRELEGALHCLQVYYRMTGQRVGASAARQVLADLERDCLRVVRMADIERVVCDVFGLDAADLKSARRARSVSEPRMLAMYLARRHTRAAYSEIGAFFGGRNHATVISADRKVGVWLEQNAQVKIASQNWRLVDVLSTIEQQLLAG
jgi:chromosomal replication initiator protein